jgi:hypothetical protein
MSEQTDAPMADEVPRAAADEPQHWLVRPASIRKLWWGFGAVLALTVLVQLSIKVKGYFGVDDWFGFGAVYGFGSCLAMVLVAKGLGAILKRGEDFYGDPGDEEVDGPAPDASVEAGRARGENHRGT